MVRTIMVPGLVLAAIGALAFGPQWLETAGTAEERPECDLLSRACTWETDEGAWRVELSTLEEGDQGMEYRLAITVPEAAGPFSGGAERAVHVYGRISGTHGAPGALELSGNLYSSVLHDGCGDDLAH